MESKLYMVATPIGNREDITLRALNILKAVDFIACEDTRHTQRLLQHYGIEKKLLACHAHNERASAEGIIKLINEGHAVAYCSDAGTPGVSDPGARLVDSVLKAELLVEPIPGPSALTTLMSVSSFLKDETIFVGFLPPKGLKREKKLEELLKTEYNFVIYEAPHRFLRFLEELTKLDAERLILVGREMTKIHAEYLRGSVSDVLSIYRGRKVLGEFVVLVSSLRK